MVEIVALIVMFTAPVMGITAAYSITGIPVMFAGLKAEKALEGSVFAVAFTGQKGVERPAQLKAVSALAVAATVKVASAVLELDAVRYLISSSDLGSVFTGKALRIVDKAAEVYLQSPSVEESHDVGVVVEQLCSAVLLFGQLSEERKDSVVVAELLGSQFDLLLTVVERMCLAKDEAVLSLLEANKLFIENKFAGNGLKLGKNV